MGKPHFNSTTKHDESINLSYDSKKKAESLKSIIILGQFSFAKLS